MLVARKNTQLTHTRKNVRAVRVIRATVGQVLNPTASAILARRRSRTSDQLIERLGGWSL